eukprot:TRINITY_DN5467_c0_g1_i1.p1 TRINITY_DN5467_c0_g1~~TRINITY_DN5467_c0_g1_i1.p1  ORF type:complete len:108 (+),score=3.94 TRINITY_DN5467_c0_g1_i1:141-464(+)
MIQGTEYNAIREVCKVPVQKILLFLSSFSLSFTCFAYVILLLITAAVYLRSEMLLHATQLKQRTQQILNNLRGRKAIPERQLPVFDLLLRFVKKGYLISPYCLLVFG